MDGTTLIVSKHGTPSSKELKTKVPTLSTNCLETKATICFEITSLIEFDDLS